MNIYDKVLKIPFGAILNAPITLLVAGKLFTVISTYLEHKYFPSENSASNNQVSKTKSPVPEVKEGVAVLTYESESSLTIDKQVCNVSDQLAEEESSLVGSQLEESVS